jgi:RNA polymerase sigma-70 factor (ECF subfamily)
VDDETIAAARRGSRKAQASLLRELQDPWYRLCLSLLRDVEKARDATQETALRFLRQLPGFRGDSQLRTWSLGIAINVVREMRRSAKPMRMLDEDPEAGGETDGLPSPANLAETAEQRENLRATLNDLPDRQREAVVLRYFEDLSTEQTAQVMNCAVGTVKATLHQALRSLREKLKERV